VVLSTVLLYAWNIFVVQPATYPAGDYKGPGRFSPPQNPNKSLSVSIIKAATMTITEASFVTGTETTYVSQTQRVSLWRIQRAM